MIDGRRGRESATQDEPETARHHPRIRLGERLVAVGVSADLVTIVGVLLAGGTGVAIGLAAWWYAVAGIIVGGLMDSLDGAVAKAAGTSSKRGAFLDSVADRVADSLIFAGLAWHLASGRDPRLALLPLAILAVSGLISYERAKAESLGFDAKGGLMERAERLILVGLAILIHAVLVPILWVVLALCCVTALGRFVRVWRQASGAVVPAPVSVWSRGRVESRWRAFRETGAHGPRASRTATRRARREDGPLSTRWRRVLGAESVGAGARRRTNSGRRTSAGRRTGSGSARTARAFRRRLDGDR